ncbi:DUF4113 domain-containing protein [Nitrosospira sp. Nsp1]|uniref:DUF4113 domain-containing protein n=1 Tax=Nitrosospira sp. Nsp1 TaxID=136547 RepID=UPI0015A1C006|nr:DUF4113 domain-containing protein [Nitrosospira sp. Nsp1]
MSTIYNTATALQFRYPVQCDTHLLVRAALYSLKKIARPALPAGKLGILADIGDTAVNQGSRFILHERRGEKSERVTEALDTLNRRYGRNTVAIASAETTNRAWGNAKGIHAALLYDKPEQCACRSGALKNKPGQSVELFRHLHQGMP